ncbi:DUF6883 domain-containing protein [Leptonema illini]|uniref:DUF6883 domain-containing protein n=1 Tax=Leptonema illini DSM 21528 TaxID=929563 RepID=H2CLK9_9LEPT|nr:DUF6883 domain-containing protein [Leptonema illini]EHQ04620.1 hypothetical protein Lepil_4142 [Leptonema illini DSM 21528]
MNSPAKLPYGDRARIDDSKITDYLLSLSHPVGSGKARFFLALGYDTESLKASLLSLAIAGEVVHHEVSPYGEKYVVDGTIVSPRSKEAYIRTVWIIDRGEKWPRLVTAHPQEAK